MLLERVKVGGGDVVSSSVDAEAWNLDLSGTRQSMQRARNEKFIVLLVENGEWRVESRMMVRASSLTHLLLCASLARSTAFGSFYYWGEAFPVLLLCK